MADREIGPYRILEQLGAGGMGEVFKATDSRIGRQVAIKILPESLAQDSDRLRRFQQEARLAASLNHPNLMAIYDVGLDYRPPYIVGELVPGESLRAIISRGPAPVRKAIDIASQIAAGLAAAHAAGVVHCDLKPENVIVTPEGTAKILDFGVARLESRSSGINGVTVTLVKNATGAVVGTAGYMSPEQARAEDVDYRSDQFSLGLVLYEMLAGKQAFERPSAVQTMSAIVEDEPAPLERHIPPQLRWILNRCLAKERDGRYESTRDLARELAQLADHYSEFATGTSAAAAVSRPPRRVNRWAVAGVIAAAVAAWCAAQLLRDPLRTDLSKYRFTPFATALPVQVFPAWSHDGKSIAFFGATESGPTQVYVQALDSPTAVAITGADVTAYPFYPPIWGADSRSVYFRCTKDGAYGICRAPAAGGESVMVQHNGLCGSISPDGRTLAMLAFDPQNGFRLRLMTASPPEAPARVYEPLPFQPAVHYNNPSVAFSPDGKKILVDIALEGHGETVVLAPWPAGRVKLLFRNGFPFSDTGQFSWMPDSRHLAFADSTPSRQKQIYMLDTATEGYSPMLVEDRPASAPSVSPNGSRMAYQSGLSHADVIAVPLKEGPVRTLLGSSRTEQMADVSPAGPQLVYVTDRRGASEVWIPSLAEGWDRPLFTPENFQVDGVPAELFFGPVFSQDGKRVAVAAKAGSQIHTYTAFVSGGAPAAAVAGTSSAFDDAPTWSPDGKWIAFARIVGNSLKLSKVRPGSGEPAADLTSIEANPVPSWSPTGEWIAVYDNHGALKLVSPDGNSSRPLPGDGGPFAWSRDGKVLYEVEMNPPALYAVDIATAQRRKLRDLPGLKPYASMNPGLHASLTSDGADIVYSVNRPRQEIWILDGIQEPRAWYRRLLGF